MPANSRRGIALINSVTRNAHPMSGKAPAARLFINEM
jgi:hypothetical protein